MVVASIYCIVIIYIPSVEEQNSKILPEPKRCVTTQVTCPDIHHDRLRVVLMKMVMALRTTMTKMMTSGGAEHHQRPRGRQVRLELLHGVVPHQGGAKLQQGGKKTKLQNINKTERQKEFFGGKTSRSACR